MNFMKEKHSPFPKAFNSKKAFLQCPCWKRAQIWLRIMRQVTGLHANKHWNKFGYTNYKLGVKVVNRYMRLDEQIIQKSAAFQAIRDEAPEPPKDEEATPVKRKKTASGFDLSSPECPPFSKTKIVFSSDDEA